MTKFLSLAGLQTFWADVVQIVEDKIDEQETATQSDDGLMSATDKTKLAGIETNANAYSLPTATTSVLGGVKPDGTTVTVDADGTIHGASEQVQADWDEYDSTSDAYVKNRPFYDDVNATSVFDSTATTIDSYWIYNQGHYLYITDNPSGSMDTLKSSFSVGVSYIVTIDGVKYRGVAQNKTYSIYNKWDGSRAESHSGVALEIPGVFILFKYGTVTTYRMFLDESANSYNVKIESYTSSVVQIPPSYLPQATASSLGAVIVDSSLSASSTNPVQNQAVKAALDALEARVAALEGGNA